MRDCNRQAFLKNKLCCLDTAACIAGVSKSPEQADVVWKQNYSGKKSRIIKEKVEKWGGVKTDIINQQEICTR